MAPILPRAALAALVGCAFAAGSATPAHAESYSICTGFIDTLPAVISTPGNWCLRKDLSTGLASGDAITLAVNNITIDCNGYRIGGLAAGKGTATAGIHSVGRLNHTVRNCSVRGFLIGLWLDGGGGHLVEDNRFDANTYLGMEVAGDGIAVRRNRVFDTGGTTRPEYAAFALGISAAGTGDVSDNAVTNLLPTPNGDGVASAIGLGVYQGPGSTVERNRVRGLVPLGSGEATGIEIHNSAQSVVADNRVLATGAGVEGVAISCSDTTSVQFDNVTIGFSTDVAQCSSYGIVY